ncbi:MAG TPA: L-lactate permease [Terracidiphilus sp.]|nr:L-lactate permease [Terracidiphilus sp.]
MEINATVEEKSPRTPKQKPATPWSVSRDVLIALALVLATVYLLKTNTGIAQWAQIYDPTGRWWLSTIVAGLPVILLLGAMAVFRVAAHTAAAIGLLTSLIAAIAVFHMPTRMALTTTVYGAGYGLFPICWIILPVIYLYQLTVKTGRFEALEKTLTQITDDSRLQLLLIAFALGAFFEGTAGFGTPVAVCGALLISLGFDPIDAAGLSLIANTAPVAFGALGIPIVALHGVTGISLPVLSRTIATILVPFCVLVPFWLIWVYAGFRRMLEVWPAILVAGVTFSVTQYLMAAYVGAGLVDITAAALTIAVLVAFLRVWKPKHVLSTARQEITGASRERVGLGGGAIFKAWLPWLILSVVVFAWGIPQISKWMSTATINLPVAGLHNLVDSVPPVSNASAPISASFTFNWLAATGTGIFVASLLAGLAMGLGPGTLVREFVKTTYNIRFAIATIAGMLALGFVMRYSGQDATLGLAFARTGVLYPFFGTLIGWVGTAATGSDTSSNVIFGSLQQVTAHQIGVPQSLMASANSAGGVMGKMISPSSIVVASTVTETYGQEGTILRYVLQHSVAMAVLVGVLVYLMAYVQPFTALVAR